MGISMKSTSGKILASVALVGTAAAVAGLGTFGEFSDSTTADQQVSAGTVNIDLLDTGSMGVAIEKMLPGDAVEKFAKLKNSGDSNFSTVTLTTTGTASLLETDSKGLKVAISACSKPWVQVVSAADTCDGVEAPVLLPSSIIMTGANLSGLSSLNPQAETYLKITTSLPAEAGNNLQGASTTVKFDFTATQRTATTS